MVWNVLFIPGKSRMVRRSNIVYRCILDGTRSLCFPPGTRSFERYVHAQIKQSLYVHPENVYQVPGTWECFSGIDRTRRGLIDSLVELIFFSSMKYVSCEFG